MTAQPENQTAISPDVIEAAQRLIVQAQEEIDQNASRLTASTQRVRQIQDRRSQTHVLDTQDGQGLHDCVVELSRHVCRFQGIKRFLSLLREVLQGFEQRFSISLHLGKSSIHLGHESSDSSLCRNFEGSAAEATSRGFRDASRGGAK